MIFRRRKTRIEIEYASVKQELCRTDLSAAAVTEPVPSPTESALACVQAFPVSELPQISTTPSAMPIANTPVKEN